jgi:hypothetical protein
MTSVRPRSLLKRLFAKKAEKPRITPYHAVAIRCGKTSCQAAQDNQRERYLSAEAPLLPLDQCDLPDQCDCRYQHYEDRRDSPRRRSEQGLSETTDSERLERRYTKDRRANADSEGAEPFSVREGSYHEHVEDTIRSETLKVDEFEGIDPYNSGSFDKSKSWKPDSNK